MPGSLSPSPPPVAPDLAASSSPGPPSTPAERALAEAEVRRVAAARAGPPETGGRGGLEPVRYGDWEVKGLASDF